MHPPFTIVPYDKKYFPALKRLIAQLQNSLKPYEPTIIASGSIAQAYSRYLLKTIRAQGGMIFLARHETTIVGFVCCWKDKDIDETKRYVYISDLCVDSKHQRQGIGSALVMAVEQWAKRQHISYLRIHTLHKNAGTWDLYKRLGFVEYVVKLNKKIL